MTRQAAKVLLLEFNEITWRLIDPLIERGVLPTFRYLKERAAWGTPTSVDLPPFLDPWITWTTVYTGTPQEVHRVFFLQQPPETIQGQRIWELAAAAGRTVGVYGSLNSWPPRPVKGFWVPDTFAQDAATYPPQLRAIQQLNLAHTRGYNYGHSRLRTELWSTIAMGLRLVRLGLRGRTIARVVGQLVQERRRPQSSWKRVSLQPEINFGFFRRLYRAWRPDFASFHTNHVAHYQHLYWSAMDPAPFALRPSAEERATYGGAIEHGYVVADRLLREALRMISTDTLLVVASSMGQQPFVSDRFPQGKRILRLRSFDALARLLERDRQLRLVPTMADQFNIYADADDVRRVVADVLQTAYIDHPGQPMFDVGGNVPGALTVNLRQYEAMTDASICHFSVQGRKKQVALGELVEVFDRLKSGYHHPEGMLMLYRPGITAGPLSGAITNLDLAPTMLAAMGLPIPAAMTGRVLGEAVPGEPLDVAR